MQKRVPEKGGDWGVTGGHPTSGETPYEGIVRETKEEIGIDISNETLEVFSQGCDGVDCYKMYYLKADYDITDFIIQKEELSEVKWFSIETLNHMIETNELNPNQVACIMKCYKYLNSKK